VDESATGSVNLFLRYAFPPHAALWSGYCTLEQTLQHLGEPNLSQSAGIRLFDPLRGGMRGSNVLIAPSTERD
jgi:hypothetical protein